MFSQSNRAFLMTVYSPYTILSIQHRPIARSGYSRLKPASPVHYKKYESETHNIACLAYTKITKMGYLTYLWNLWY